jgi:hypothetical protein
MALSTTQLTLGPEYGKYLENSIHCIMFCHHHVDALRERERERERERILYSRRKTGDMNYELMVD